MSTITIELNDEVARAVRAAAQMAQQPVENWVREKIRLAAESSMGYNKAGGTSRVFPLHPGAMEILPGFSEPLDEFSPYV